MSFDHCGGQRSGAAPDDSETAAPEDPETAASAAHPRYSVHPDVRRRNGGSIVHSAFDLCGCPQRSTCAPRHSAQGHEQLCRRALHSITRWHWCQRPFSECHAAGRTEAITERGNQSATTVDAHAARLRNGPYFK
eukprot:scaffold3967_cov72-Phaeocystis_antarctica.AAC.1